MTQSENIYGAGSAFFAKELLAWYRRHRRELPWRRNKDPYRVWVSEIMLQQTRVDTVIPYYERFMERFPTVDALAEAPEDDVLKHWEGLGYYSRARNLHSAAREVREKYGSQFPREKEAVSSLKGIGAYTTGAILSIAFDQPEPAVDGNVMRVLSRFFLIEEDVAKSSVKTDMEERIRAMMPRDAAGDFTQALMELGALICTPKSPQCLVCPVMERCQGHLAGMEDQLPVKKKAKPPRHEMRIGALVIGTGPHERKVLVRRRPERGLLANMWELPHMLWEEADPPSGEAPAKVEDRQSRAIQSNMAEAELRSGWELVPEGRFTSAEHVFSHIHWHLQIYKFVAVDKGGAAELPESCEWIDRLQFEQYTFPQVFIRILQPYFLLSKS